MEMFLAPAAAEVFLAPAADSVCEKKGLGWIHG